MNLCLVWLNELKLVSKKNSKNWTFFFTRLKELNLLFYMTQRIEPSFWTCLNELNPFEKYDSKNRIWLKQLVFFLVWLKDLNLFFFEYDSKNWTLLIWLDFFFFLKIWPLVLMFSFPERDSKKWTIFNLTQGLNFFQFDSKNEIWLKGLNLIEPLRTTQRIELFKKYDSKKYFITKYISQNWIFLEKKDSKDWTFFQYDSKNWTLLKNWPKALSLFFSTRLKELNPFFSKKKIDSKMTQKRKLEELNFIFKNDSEKWTFF